MRLASGIASIKGFHKASQRGRRDCKGCQITPAIRQGHIAICQSSCIEEEKEEGAAALAQIAEQASGPTAKHWVTTERSANDVRERDSKVRTICPRLSALSAWRKIDEGQVEPEEYQRGVPEGHCLANEAPT